MLTFLLAQMYALNCDAFDYVMKGNSKMGSNTGTAGGAMYVKSTKKVAGARSGGMKVIAEDKSSIASNTGAACWC